MPSAAKRRKAAKKKKERVANITSSTNNTPLGNDDPKSQDEGESDGGDACSPAAQGHQNTNKKPMEGVAQDIKGTAKVGAEDNGAVKIQREMEFKGDLGDQAISIEHVEFSKESNDGSSSSSTSSSDNESETVKKASKKAIQGTEKASGKAVDLVAETAPAVDSIKPLVTVAKEAMNVTENNSYKNSLTSDFVESRLKENEELRRDEDEVIPLSEESVEVSWTVVEPVINENEGMSLPLSVVPESSNSAEIRDSKIIESSENQPFLAPAPQVEKRTSCMSCCGLFDVLTGSGR